MVVLLSSANKKKPRTHSNIKLVDDFVQIYEGIDGSEVTERPRGILLLYIGTFVTIAVNIFVPETCRSLNWLRRH